MGGLEHGVECYTREVCQKFDAVTYLEIGIARGETLTGIASMISSIRASWRAVGVDLPDGYSLNLSDVAGNAYANKLNFVVCNNGSEPPDNYVTVYLKPSHEFMQTWNRPIHIALIDGCHCKQCTMDDFTNIAKHVPVGGIVMFHDFTLEYVGAEQPHGTRCAVVPACAELGLLDKHYPGWEWCDTLKGERDMGVFRRV
jgi:hypothetical protein